jgi:hypothetical protein
MLINFLKKGTYGYLREDRVGIYSFISNNNLSLRRKAIVEAGGYDDALRIAEDYDVCQRLGGTGWLPYFCPEVSCDHRARKKVTALLKQWWNYGLHLALGYRRHHPGRVVVSLASPKWRNSDSPEPIRRGHPGRPGRRRPVNVFVHVSLFVMMHVAGAALLVAIAYGNQPVTWTMAMIATALLLGYARTDFEDLRQDGLRKALGLFVIRFAVNSAFVWGGLLGSLKCGAFYIFPTIHTRAVAGEAGRPRPASKESMASAA